MSSICIQTFKDLAIPFSTLPFGDKNDYAHAEKTCQLWIKTTVSTAIAVGFFFTNIAACKVIYYTLDCIADVFDPTNSNISFFQIITRSAFFYVSPMIYSRFDSHATDLCCLAANIYHGFQNYRSRYYLFLGANALFAAKLLAPQENAAPVQHWGSWRRPIRNFAKSWAPTMATWYGYQEAHA